MLLRNRFALPIALAGALLLPAVPAAADDDDDGWRGHRGGHHRRGDHHGGRHYKHHGDKHHGGHHRHHRGCGHGGHGGHRYYAPRYVVKNHYHGYPVHHYGGYAPSAYCGPCGGYFDSYDDLSYHVHHHHHVAALELPFVIFQASIGGGAGWVFGH